MAYLTQILRLPNSSFSRTLASKFYPTITNQDWFACSIFNCTIHSSTGSFRAFGSFAAKSEDGMVDHQEFQKWSNGGGLCHNLACIDPTAVVEIGAVIHERATLGANVHVGSGSVVGPCVRVGQSTSLGLFLFLPEYRKVVYYDHASLFYQLKFSSSVLFSRTKVSLRYNVALSNCLIGDSCVFHNGVCIGQDGFGFFVDGHGNMAKKPQALYVRIGNHVEIGANTCVDRGSWRDTTVGNYTTIDNLVQIGHNVIIGRSCILCGQVGIAGSATIGDYVTFGGRVAVCDHVSIVSKVRLAANSCVTKDIKEPGDYGGFPAVPVQQWRRQIAALRLNSMKDIKNP